MLNSVMVPTAACGCGIDVPDVRLIIHVESIYDMISFFQKSGRAGRDGLTSYSYILHVPEVDDSFSQTVHCDLVHPSDSDGHELCFMESTACPSEIHEFGAMSAILKPSQQTSC